MSRRAILFGFLATMALIVWMFDAGFFMHGD
jgi:hypothetical protein